MIIKRDEAFMAVCELRTQIDANTINVGTGMFLSSPAPGDNQNYGWIVTATHVAMETNDHTVIVISTKEGMAATLPLKLFGTIGWKHHHEADLSVFRVVFTPINQPFVDGRFFPLDHFNLEKKVVSRDFELTAIGFPHGLGTEGFRII